MAGNDVGLRAVLAPKVDEREADQEVSKLEDMVSGGDYSLKPDISLPDDMAGKARAGAGRAVGRMAGKALPGKTGAAAGGVLGEFLAGDRGGPDGRGEGPTDAETGESQVDLAIERNEILEEIREAVEDEEEGIMRAGQDGDSGILPFGAGAAARGGGSGTGIAGLLGLLGGGGAAMAGGGLLGATGSLGFMGSGLIGGQEMTEPGEEPTGPTNIKEIFTKFMFGGAEGGQPDMSNIFGDVGSRIKEQVKGSLSLSEEEMRLLENIEVSQPDWLDELKLEVPSWLEDLSLDVPDWLSDLSVDVPDWLQNLDLGVPDWLKNIELEVPDWLQRLIPGNNNTNDGGGNGGGGSIQQWFEENMMGGDLEKRNLAAEREQNRSNVEVDASTEFNVDFSQLRKDLNRTKQDAVEEALRRFREEMQRDTRSSGTRGP